MSEVVPTVIIDACTPTGRSKSRMQGLLLNWHKKPSSAARQPLDHSNRPRREWHRPGFAVLGLLQPGCSLAFVDVGPL